MYNCQGVNLDIKKKYIYILCILCTRYYIYWAFYKSLGTYIICLTQNKHKTIQNQISEQNKLYFSLIHVPADIGKFNISNTNHPSKNR